MIPETDFSPQERIEQSYNQTLQNLFKEFMRIVEPLPLTDPWQVLDILQGFSNTAWFTEFSYAAASRMVTMLRVDGAKNWREAASQSSRGRMIYQALKTEMGGPVGDRVQSLINENAKLISSLPEDVRELAATFIEEETQKGRRAENIVKDLVKQFPEVTGGRLRLIARTETSKANTALTQARAEGLNLPWYDWQSSRDGIRVRVSHRFMDGSFYGKTGILINWGDPPNPMQLAGVKESDFGAYHVGGCPNCRCWPYVLIDIDSVLWPHRVYYSGEVVTMRRNQFLQIAGGRLAA